MELSEIKSFLADLNLPKDEIIFVHVKLKGISYDTSYKQLSKQIIEILQDLYSPKTILVPTFTYSYTETGIFNRISSPSEVGRFGEEIRNLFDPKHRTINPVFNVIDTNNYFKKNYDLKEESAFGEDSLMHLLHKLGHVVLNINVDEFISTYLHYLEYCYNVPYRFIKNFPGEVIISNQDKKEVVFQYDVRDLDKNSSWDRGKIRSVLYEQCGLQIFVRENLEVMWVHSKEMEKILGPKLKADGNFLLA